MRFGNYTKRLHENNVLCLSRIGGGREAKSDFQYIAKGLFREDLLDRGRP